MSIENGSSPDREKIFGVRVEWHLHKRIDCVVSRRSGAPAAKNLQAVASNRPEAGLLREDRAYVSAILL